MVHPPLHPGLLFPLFTAGVLLSGCRSTAVGSTLATATAPGTSPQEVQARDPGLDRLGLVYDDTIVTTSARTVDFNGQALVPRYVHIEKSGAGKDLTVDVTSLKAVFGLRENLTISLAVPFVSKRLRQGAAGPTLRSDGIGDAALVGKLRFFQKTGLGETTEAAALFGLKLPSGRDGVRDAGMVLPQPLQPGSGSIDALLGGAFTRVKGRWLLNADLVTKLNSEANGYRFGNRLSFDVGGQYRVYPARYERYDQTTVNLVAEFNGVWSGRDRLGGSPVVDSGGTKLFATPGLQVIVSENLLFESAVQLPILMNLEGTQLEEDFVAILGLRARF